MNASVCISTADWTEKRTFLQKYGAFWLGEGSTYASYNRQINVLGLTSFMLGMHITEEPWKSFFGEMVSWSARRELQLH